MYKLVLPATPGCCALMVQHEHSPKFILSIRYIIYCTMKKEETQFTKTRHGTEFKVNISNWKDFRPVLGHKCQHPALA